MAIRLTLCFFNNNRSPLGWRKVICVSSRWRGWVTWACGAVTCARVRLAYRTYTQKVKPQEVELVRRDYSANGGWETFLSYEVSLFVFSYGQFD